MKLICMGDSLTEGYDIDLSKRWTHLLAKELGIDIINKGISGDSTGGMLARFKTDVLDLNPTHVLIMGGTNDLRLNVPHEMIFSNILSMIRHARFHEIISIIGVPTPYYYSTSDHNKLIFVDAKELSNLINDFRARLLQFAIDDECPFVDFNLPDDMSFYLPDELHPNELGHEKMKDIAADQIRSLHHTK